MKQKRRKKRKGSNRGVTSICFIVLILLVILSVQSQGLKEKLKVYAAQQEELQQKVFARLLQMAIRQQQLLKLTLRQTS